MFFNFWHVLAWFLTNLKQRLDQGQLRPTKAHKNSKTLRSIHPHSCCQRSFLFHQRKSVAPPSSPAWAFSKLHQQAAWTFKQARACLKKNSSPALMSKIFEYTKHGYLRYLAHDSTKNVDFYMVLLTFYIIFQEHQECNVQNTPSTINFFHNTTNTTGVLAAHLVLTPFLQLELKNRDQAVLNSKQGHVVKVCQFTLFHTFSENMWGTGGHWIIVSQVKSTNLTLKKKRNRCSTRWTAQFLGALRPKCLGKWTAATLFSQI